MAKTMSGSGGFYKYRCKHFYGKSCQNWVYVNGEACMTCLAEGCDAESTDWERSSSPNVCDPCVRVPAYGYAAVGADGSGTDPVRGPEGIVRE